MHNKSFIVHNVPKHQQLAAVKIIKSMMVARSAEAWRKDRRSCRHHEQPLFEPLMSPEEARELLSRKNL